MTENISIPIVVASDENYALGLVVTLYSLFTSKHRETHYSVHVLDGGLSESTQQHLIELAKSYQQQIDFTNMEDSYKDLPVGKLSPATYYRLDIVNLFPHYDKVLFLDVDILVQGDLSELFSTDMTQGEGALLAGVEDIGNTPFNFHNFGLHYLNAGVLVMNLHGFRQQRIDGKIKELLDTVDLKQHDQDAFNWCAQGQTVTVDLKYNFFNLYATHPRTWRKPTERFSFNKAHKLTVKELKMKAKEAVIIHYVSDKPWRSYSCPMGSPWRAIYKECPLLPEHKNQCEAYSLTSVLSWFFGFLFYVKVRRERVIQFYILPRLPFVIEQQRFNFFNQIEIELGLGRINYLGSREAREP